MKELAGTAVTIFLALGAAVAAWVNWRGKVSTEVEALKAELKKAEASAKEKETRDSATFKELWRYINSSNRTIAVLVARVDGLAENVKIRDLLEANQAQLMRIETKLNNRN